MDLGAYVQQEDVFWESYTVRELFQEAAHIRTSMGKKEIDERVHTMIEELKL